MISEGYSKWPHKEIIHADDSEKAADLSYWHWNKYE